MEIATVVYPQIKNGVPELRAKRARESLIIEVMSSKLCASEKLLFCIIVCFCWFFVNPSVGLWG